MLATDTDNLCRKARTHGGQHAPRPTRVSLATRNRCDSGTTADGFGEALTFANNYYTANQSGFVDPSTKQPPVVNVYRARLEDDTLISSPLGRPAAA